jgi:hypothetical protein
MKLPLLLGALIVIGAASLEAHHSYGDYLGDKIVSVEGDVTQFWFANPHVLLTIKTSNLVSYATEWSNINRLSREGVTNATLKVGDHVIVRGSPKRNPADHTISLVREVRRPADGWYWSSVQPR